MDFLEQTARGIAEDSKASWFEFLEDVDDPELRLAAAKLAEQMAFLYLAKATGRTTEFIETSISSSIQSLRAAGMIHVAVAIRVAIWKRFRQATGVVVSLLAG